MNSLGDIIEQSLIEFLRGLFQPVQRFIRNHGNSVLDLIVSTPSPNAVFEQPGNGPWPDIYAYYWDTIVPLSLLLWALSIGLIILLESTSHLFSNYHRTKLKKRAFSGLVGILSWWWLAAISLRLIDGLASFLLPSLADLSMFDVTSIGAMGVLGLVISATVDIALFVIVALVYYMRQVVLYLSVLLMPILIAFWVPGVGPFTLVSKFMKRLAGFYVPFLFMTVPVALLFRLGELLGSSVAVSLGGVGQWLAAITIPFVAIASPFVLFWQAGALFFMSDRAAQHSSRRRARQRVQRVRSAGSTAQQGGQNFGRGLQGAPAVRSDGQTVFESGDSQAHAAGSRLAAAGRSLRTTLRSDGGSQRAGTRESTAAGMDDSRNDQFDNLADPSTAEDSASTPASETEDVTDSPDDDRPQ